MGDRGGRYEREGRDRDRGNYRDQGRPQHFKKRRYQDDDERDYRQQRPRYEDPMVRLRKDVLAIAESPLIKVEDSIRSIAKSLSAHWDHEAIRKGFVSLVKFLVVEQPFKIPFVAAIVLCANAQKHEIGKLVLDEFAAQLQEYLDRCEWRNFKLMLRFMGSVSCMLDGEGVATLLNDLATLTGDLAAEGGSSGLSEELSHVILITIPYILTSAPGGITEEFLTNLIERIGGMQVTAPIEPLICPYTGPNAPYPAMNATALLLNALKEEVNNGFKFEILARPWEPFLAELEAATKHFFPNISMPTSLAGGTIFPKLYFSVFQGAIYETVPAPTSIASSILRDSIGDTIGLLDFNRIACARFLIDVDCYFSPNAFVKRATPFDKIAEVPEGGSTWKPEDICVDAIFTNIFQLPQPEHKLVYYHAALTEVCKLAPQAVAPSLGRAIRYLYRNLESMDVELRYRFIDWFAHHLSNFGYTWKWTEWIPDLQLSKIHPKRSFIQEAVEKELRLSFANRIKSTLPEEYVGLVPEDKEKDVPEFKFEADDIAFPEEGKQLLNLIRQKAPNEEVDTLMNAITEAASNKGLPDATKYARDMYVTCICHIGAKSLSHVLSCIERCKDKLTQLGQESNQAQRQIVGTVMHYWAEQPGIGANVIDKLLNYSILTPLSVVEWVLLDAGREVLPRGHAWEMVNTTVRKVVSRTRNLAAARGAPDLPEEQMTIMEQGHEVAKAEQAELFKVVMEGLAGYADGSVPAPEGTGEEDAAWLKVWSGSWLRALKRQSDIEEAEEAMRVSGAGDADAGAGASADAGADEGADADATMGEGEDVAENGSNEDEMKEEA
ncbi:hypothetical protein DRE_02404 [Drechslerella stenobrocha 248]|uniref:MIF4G domain-containing protein n=1 Tax=Drechslerella stenobrocha 248 TaxID=1043628 RepID=W7IGH9_9PEZI|nr:hypothetical protein DRE_02404 [Drechslerella stenobrocha 248]